MENKNFEYTGWKINGFVALLAILAAIVGAIFMIVAGAESPVPVGPILVIAGILILLLIFVVVQICQLKVMSYLFENFLQAGIIAIVVVFQPELRRMLEQFGGKLGFKSVKPKSEIEKSILALLQIS